MSTHYTPEEWRKLPEAERERIVEERMNEPGAWEQMQADIRKNLGGWREPDAVDPATGEGIWHDALEGAPPAGGEPQR